MSPFELKTQHLILDLRYALEASDNYRSRAAMLKLLSTAHEDSPHLGLDRVVATLKAEGKE